MECGQFVGKVKPETWWENPWDFSKIGHQGRSGMERRMMELRIFGDSIWRFFLFLSDGTEVEFVFFCFLFFFGG